MFIELEAFELDSELELVLIELEAFGGLILVNHPDSPLSVITVDTKVLALSAEFFIVPAFGFEPLSSEIYFLLLLVCTMFILAPSSRSWSLFTKHVANYDRK